MRDSLSAGASLTVAALLATQTGAYPSDSQHRSSEPIEVALTGEAGTTAEVGQALSYLSASRFAEDAWAIQTADYSMLGRGSAASEALIKRLGDEIDALGDNAPSAQTSTVAMALITCIVKNSSWGVREAFVEGDGNISIVADGKNFYADIGISREMTVAAYLRDQYGDEIFVEDGTPLQDVPVEFWARVGAI